MMTFNRSCELADSVGATCINCGSSDSQRVYRVVFANEVSKLSIDVCSTCLRELNAKVQEYDSVNLIMRDV